MEMGLPIQDQPAVRASNVMALIASNLEVANSKFWSQKSRFNIKVKRMYSKDLLCYVFQHVFMLITFVGMALLIQTQNAVMV